MIKKPIKLSEKKRKGLFEELRSILGEDRVSIEEGVRLSYAGAALAPKCIPDFVVKPRCTEDVQNVLKFANKNLIPVTPVASGTQETSTHPFFGGVVVDMMAMNKILEINTDGAYTLIEPGVTIGALAKEVRKYNFRITVGSFPPGVSVVGNYTLYNVNTHRTTSLDDVIALEVVLPEGKIVRTGSAAFSSSYNTSYFSFCNSFPDLKHLFMNAYGTLGIITKASVRLYEVGEESPLLVVGFSNFEKALKFMKKVSRGNLCQHCCIWHWVNYTVIDHLQIYKHGAPSEVMVYDPQEVPDERPYCLVVPTISGYREDIEGKLKAIKRLIGESGGVNYTETCSVKFPGAYQFFYEHFCQHIPTTTFMGGYGEAKPLFPIVFAPPDKIVDYEKWGLSFLRNSPLKLGLTYYCHSADQGRSMFLRFTPFIPHSAEEEEIMKAKETYNKVMEEAFSRYGAVPIRNVTREDLQKHLKKMDGFTYLLKVIKRAVDPNNIMNSGFGIYLY